MWRWRLILNDWPCAGAHPLNTTRGCRGRDLVALARTAGESTPRRGADRSIFSLAGGPKTP
jgi:hypothetical protein